MSRALNPFDALYTTEFLRPEEYVEVFSPVLVDEASPLFRPGNVILIGTQGSGKSMLLNLLRSETRIQFARARAPFPPDRISDPFVGAGINLTHSGATEFGQRQFAADPAEAEVAIQLYFGDFLNYWIVRDLVESMSMLADGLDESIDLPFDIDSRNFDRFAQMLSRDACWLGWLDDVRGLADLRTLLDRRIVAYRTYLNYNSDELGLGIESTKTTAGAPISAAADALRGSGVIGHDVSVFVQIDQYEELGRLERWLPFGGQNASLTSVIHRMLGRRDPSVSYRIGARRAAWPQRPGFFATSAVAEELRDYKVVDLDGILRPREHTRGTVFRKFASDVLRRRLVRAGYTLDCARGHELKAVFGSSPSAEAKSLIYSPRHRAGKVDATEGTAGLISPLEQRLSEAWQQQQERRGRSAAEDGLPVGGSVWWRKGRSQQALLQIASRQRQRLIWFGEQDIIALSGENILAFMSICQSIFDGWLRHTDSAVAEQVGTIDVSGLRYVQDVGVYDASSFWHRKMRADPEGDQRQRVADFLGRQFRDWLLADTTMSYPGHNGFSVLQEELQADPDVYSFLTDAAGYGILVESVHVDRSSPKKRHRWYLNPVLAPYYQIPAGHVKEPRYVRVGEVRLWLEELRVIDARSSGRRGHRRLASFEGGDQEQLWVP